MEISKDVARELPFWKSCFDHFHGQPLRPLHPVTAVCTYPDASDFAWGGYTVRKGKEMVARGGWPAELRESSSTFRELRAAFLVMSSLVEKLKNSSVIHRTDNQAALIILATGSRRKHLQEEAIKVFKVFKVFSLCMQHGIRLYIEWIPREENENADYFSKLEDEDDWMLSPQAIQMIDRAWGPHSIDRFASSSTAQLRRFSSRWWNPGCESVDCFTTDWVHEVNWWCPPPLLTPRVIRHAKRCQADGSLLIPYWNTAAWWPLVAESTHLFYEFVSAVITLEPHAGLFRAGTCR